MIITPFLGSVGTQLLSFLQFSMAFYIDYTFQEWLQALATNMINFSNKLVQKFIACVWCCQIYNMIEMKYNSNDSWLLLAWQSQESKPIIGEQKDESISPYCVSYVYCRLNVIHLNYCEKDTNYRYILSLFWSQTFRNNYFQFILP